MVPDYQQSQQQYQQHQLAFHLPWEHDDEERTIHADTAAQLELAESRCSAPCVYESLVEPQTKAAHDLFPRMAESFSNQPAMIAEQRQTLRGIAQSQQPLLTPAQHKALDTLRRHYKSIGEDTGFRSKFGFIDFDRLAFLNEIPVVVTMLVMYNVGSPLFSLLSPLVGALLAYMLVLIRGGRVSLSVFLEVLGQRLRWLLNIKQLFSPDAAFFTRIKVVLTAGLYGFSIYQNIRSCRSFIRNYATVAETYSALAIASDTATTNIRRLTLSCTDADAGLAEYWLHAGALTAPARQVIDHMRPYMPLGVTKPTSVPLALRLFYKFKHSVPLRTAIDWLLGVGGLCDIYDGLARGWRSGRLGAYLCTTDFDTAFSRNLYHPVLGHGSVRNTLALQKSMVLTGRNGSGKTTLAKSLAIACIVGSQFGVAPASKIQMPPLSTIRCELNIPDTNERDSLFEAEARRCLELIDTIAQEPDDFHLCIFDELFSGTNADEALDAATGVLTNLSRSYKVRFLVTTHMHALGKRLGSNVAQSLAMTTKDGRPTHRAETGVTTTSGARDTLVRIGFTDQQLGNTEPSPEEEGEIRS